MKRYTFLVFFFVLVNCTKESGFTDDNLPDNTLAITSINTLGGTKNDVLQAVVKTNDGGYVTTGHTQSNNGDVINKSNEGFDFWVLKFSDDNTLVWNKTYGGLGDDRASTIIQTSDNGFAVLGYSKSLENNTVSNTASQDFWLLKLNEAGEVSWQKTFGFSGSDFGTKVIQTSDNGYLLIGVLDVSASNGLGNLKISAKKHAGGDFWAIKLDASGNLQWSKFYGGSFTEEPKDVVETTDGNFIIAGATDSNDIDIKNSQGSYDFWVIKITSTGSLVWEKSYGGSQIDQARAIVATNDGNFMIVGDTRSTDKQVTENNGDADVWLLKIDTNGGVIWQKSIGASAFDVARSMVKTKDNNYMIVGSSRSLDKGFTNNGLNDGLLLNVDNQGNVLWQKTVGGDKIDFLYGITALNDGSFVAVGESNSNNKDVVSNKGFTDALIIKIE